MDVMLANGDGGTPAVASRRERSARRGPSLLTGARALKGRQKPAIARNPVDDQQQC